MTYVLDDFESEYRFATDALVSPCHVTVIVDPVENTYTVYADRRDGARERVAVYYTFDSMQEGVWKEFGHGVIPF